MQCAHSHTRGRRYGDQKITKKNPRRSSPAKTEQKLQRKMKTGRKTVLYTLRAPARAAARCGTPPRWFQVLGRPVEQSGASGGRLQKEKKKRMIAHDDSRSDDGERWGDYSRAGEEGGRTEIAAAPFRVCAGRGLPDPPAPVADAVGGGHRRRDPALRLTPRRPRPAARVHERHRGVVERVAEGVVRAADDRELFLLLLLLFASASDVVVAAAGAGGTAEIAGVAAVPSGRAGCVSVLSHARSHGSLRFGRGVPRLYDGGGGCGGGGGGGGQDRYKAGNTHRNVALKKRVFCPCPMQRKGSGGFKRSPSSHPPRGKKKNQSYGITRARQGGLRSRLTWPHDCR